MKGGTGRGKRKRGRRREWEKGGREFSRVPRKSPSERDKSGCFFFPFKVKVVLMSSGFPPRTPTNPPMRGLFNPFILRG